MTGNGQSQAEDPAQVLLPAALTSAPAMPRPIEAHGVVGDQNTAALVADDGTVDFLCWPGFDGPSVFAALLDPERGGAWSIAPALDGGRRRQQMYLPDTHVLLTRFATPGGVSKVTDFMPFPEPDGTPSLVRRVRVVRGEMRFALRCAPRLDYARGRTRAEADGDGVVFSGEDGPALRLWGSVPLAVETGADGGAAVAAFTMRAGECADFVLLDAGEPPGQPDPEALFRACVKHWHDWAGCSTYKGRWREMVTRSALVLKLLTSRRHGSVVAAATFGLPEAPGGPRTDAADADPEGLGNRLHPSAGRLRGAAPSGGRRAHAGDLGRHPALAHQDGEEEDRRRGRPDVRRPSAHRRGSAGRSARLGDPELRDGLGDASERAGGAGRG